MSPPPKPKPPEPAAPAVVTAQHMQDRSFVTEIQDGKETKRIVSKIPGWRKLTPLQCAMGKDQLAGGCAKYDALLRFAAGQRYAEIFDLTERSGRDSTQGLNVSRSGTMGSNNDAQDRAWALRLAVESHMGERDRQIIRMVCGEGFWPSEAVRAVCGDYRDTVAARFREALDALIEAFEATRQTPEKFSTEVQP